MSIDPQFRQSLVSQGLLIETSVPGLYGHGARLDAIITRLEASIAALGADFAPELMRFPPVMPRRIVQESGYLQAFPHLLGTVHCFHGDDLAHTSLLQQLATGDDSWLATQAATETVLTPAACYPVYPAVAARGPLPQAGHVVDVQSWCFRHEPSPDPASMQAFRQREFVFMGLPPDAAAFRETWQLRAVAFAQRLALPHRVQAANDPFFGWQGEIMAELQRDQALKAELLIPISDSDAWTACISFNTHHDHFSRPCGLHLPGGGYAHTTCVGFGLERLALALLKHRGLSLDPGQIG